mgnify:CR=1 FL=1
MIFEIWFKVPLPKGPLEACSGWTERMDEIQSLMHGFAHRAVA